MGVFVRSRALMVAVGLVGIAASSATAVPVSPEREFASCLATKQPEILSDLQAGLKSGKYSLEELRSFEDKSPPNDISFYMVQLLYKFCLAGNAPTPRLHENVLREELLRATPKSAEGSQ